MPSEPTAKGTTVPLDAVIWDLDGVILDSELQHVEAEIDTFESFRIPVTRELAMSYMGARMEEYISEVVKGAGSDIPPSRVFDAHYETLRRYYGEVFGLSPHAREVLTETAGVLKQALATNREEELARLALERHGLHTLFDAAVYGDTVERGKPDPEVFLRAAGLLGCAPASCLVIEDSLTGLQAAREADMRVVIRQAAHNRHVDFSAADYLVTDLRDIPPLIRGIARS
jgi:HAD superfamily hydrolase (TIGR01509 family)